MHTRKVTRRKGRRKNPVAVKKMKSLACDYLVLTLVGLVLLGLAKGA